MIKARRFHVETYIYINIIILVRRGVAELASLSAHDAFNGRRRGLAMANFRRLKILTACGLRMSSRPRQVSYHAGS